jgi:hypothetical protein
MDQGVVMVYEIRRAESAAWYAAFHRDRTWQLVQTIGIGAGTVRQYLEKSPDEPT